MLTFDEATHGYKWKGTPVPSVTQVIRSALGDQFAGVSHDAFARKRMLGQAAHRACELDSLGMLDEATVHPEVWPYLLAWRRFIFESGFKVVASEELFYEEVYGYAGRRDCRGYLDGAQAVVDFKTGAPGMVGIQTAGYAMAGYAIDSKWRRFALLARDSGGYRFEECKSPADFADFLACLRIHRIKERLNQ